ncbi:Cyclin-T1-4 [Datura stramonium]|uniref:Cyclin-T1-4 n=1 Tax=Datura stramonium TaxID=4076 RepID=A0ABS8WJS7_DATST|nr:Cyclin-T1-4 [Datura stramonium]
MAGLMTGDPSTHHEAYEGGSFRASQERPDENGGRWYLSRKEIEENSPSRLNGIDLKKETYLRKSYCTFLQDLGMRLKVVLQTKKLQLYCSSSASFLPLLSITAIFNLWIVAIF